jgi:hypothetical protein
MSVCCLSVFTAGVMNSEQLVLTSGIAALFAIAALLLILKDCGKDLAVKMNVINTNAIFKYFIFIVRCKRRQDTIFD